MANILVTSLCFLRVSVMMSIVCGGRLQSLVSLLRIIARQKDDSAVWSRLRFYVLFESCIYA